MSTRIKAEPQTHLSTTWPHAEIANLKAENARLQSALATAERRIAELEHQWRSHRDSALRWENLYREATGARDEEPDDEVVF